MATKTTTKTKKGDYIEAVGRRKTATARVRLYHTTKPADAENPTDITPTLSAMTVNDKPAESYFPLKNQHRVITSPFQKADLLGKFSVTIQTKGGGVSAQAFAIRHGIARALVSFNEDLRKKLKVFGYLTRDPRVVERKKYGLKKARRAPQWSKR
jgi:small subunit ribosomal protein S9